MGKLHKIKRQFKKQFKGKAGSYTFGPVWVRVYERLGMQVAPDWWVSNWNNCYKKFLDKLIPEYRAGVGLSD